MEQEGTISSNFSSNITHQDRFKLLFGLYLECFFSLFTLKLKFERRLWRNFSLIKIRIFNFPYYSSSTFSGSPRLRSFVSQDLSIDSPSKIIFKHFFFFTPELSNNRSSYNSLTTPSNQKRKKNRKMSESIESFPERI